MKRLSSRDNAFYKGLLRISGNARQRAKAGQTLLDGAHLLAAYLASGKQPRHLLLTAAALQDAEIAALLHKMPQVPCTQLDDGLFGALSELKTLSGMLALIDIPTVAPDPAQSRFCLLLENIQDPGNLGSMLRTAAAAGCDAVYLSAGCADAWSPRVLRAAMGGHFVLQLQEHADLLNVTENFRGSVYAAALAAQASLYACNLQGKVAFAIGNEGAGLSEALQARTRTFRIPMPGCVESLNAAAAAAICLFEAVRQRN